MKRAIVFLLILLVFNACTSGSSEQEPKDITLDTEDNVKLSASYLKGGKEKGIILLHMLGKDKESWLDLSKVLNEKGYSVISIDFRGHGGSELNYQTFSEEDWKKLTLDVEAAASYLKSKRVKKIYIVGASIGANAAINYASQDTDVKGLALLSPGMTYRGLHAGDALSKYYRKLLLVATSGDKYSYESVGKMQGIKSTAQKITYQGDAHGTDMFQGTTLKEDLIAWLSEN